MFTLKIKVKFLRDLKALSKKNGEALTRVVWQHSVNSNIMFDNCTRGQQRTEFHELNDDIKSILQTSPTCAGSLEKNCSQEISRLQNNGKLNWAPSSFFFSTALCTVNKLKIYFRRLYVYCFNAINQVPKGTTPLKSTLFKIYFGN